MHFPSIARRCGLLAFLAASAGAAASPAHAQADAAPPPVTDYTIHVRLDAQTKRLHGTQTLRYTNRSPDRIPDLQFHLYLNAFKNERSTFMRESGGVLRTDEMPEEGWGWIDVKTLTVGGTDYASAMQFIQPDGTDPDDQTVMRVPLERPLEPGATAVIEMAFEAQLPKVFARTGYHDEYYLVGQWFPKIGVWETVGHRRATAAGWNCHQFHANSEFYADFGRYEVHLTVPDTLIVGATGVQTARVHDDEAGTRTYTFAQDRVIDFAWTASPRFLPHKRVFHMADWVSEADVQRAMDLHGLPRTEVALPDVTMILLLQPEHADQVERYFRALGVALAQYGLRYGPYPYPQITLVDPAWNAWGSGGMEYPTFITGGTDWLAPPDSYNNLVAGPNGPEGVTIHEFAHQYWQSIVATNEFEEPWLDEGFNTYTTGPILDESYGPSVQYAGVNQLPVPLFTWLDIGPLTQRQMFRIGVMADRGTDQIARHAWQFKSTESYGVNSYPKTGAVLYQLQREVGADVMARIMRTYYERWKFRHPTTRDFIDVAEDVAGRDLDAFFDRFLFSPGTLDFAVTKAESERIGFEAGVHDGPEGRVTVSREVAAKRRKEADEADEPGTYRTVVEITNHGDLHHAVNIRIRFEDGEEVHERWHGGYRWVRYTYERDAKLDRVVVDPEERIVVDPNRANDSYVAEPALPAGLRWPLKVLLLMQHALLAVGDAVG